MVNGTVGIARFLWSRFRLRSLAFLLSLRLPQHLTSLVWLAGPLCGALVQPILGAHSDRCRHPWGRQKPYIIGGAAATVVSLLGLAYSSSIVPATARLMSISR